MTQSLPIPYSVTRYHFTIGQKWALSEVASYINDNITVGGTGDVVGPASSTNNAVVLFDGTTGKLIKDSAAAYSPTGIGLGSVTNDAQTKAAIVPNTAPASGEVLVGNAGGTAYAKQAISGDATLASTGALTLANSGVSAGSYTFASVTVDAKGRVTAASSGTPNAGTVVGYAYTKSTTSTSTSSYFPLDSTIPQITEGAEYTQIATSITPKSATNLLRIRVYISEINTNITSTPGFGIFVSGTNDALSATQLTLPAGYYTPLTMETVMVAGTTSQMDFKFRYGAQSGYTVYLVHGSIDYFGASKIAFMEIQEIQV